MNTTKVSSVAGTIANQVSSPTWQVEIQQLYRNYFVMDEILSQAIGLSTETINRYTTLQQVITNTIETLLEDLDRAERSNKPGYKTSQLLKKHALIIKQLNTRVYGIVKEATA